MRVQTGRTLYNEEHGDFETFMGDLYPLLKEKWCQWLATTYSERSYCLICDCLLNPPSV